MTESTKRYRAVIQMSGYSFAEAAEEIARGGYTLTSLTEIEDNPND